MALAYLILWTVTYAAIVASVQRGPEPRRSRHCNPPWWERRIDVGTP